MGNKKLGRKAQIYLVIVSSIVVVLSLAVCVFNYFFDSMCANAIKNTIESPDKQLKAVVFCRDCGATTSQSRQVSILSAESALPNDPGNVFIIDEGNPPGAQLSLCVRWTSNRSLEIQYNPSARVFISKRSLIIPRFPVWQKVEISYMTRPTIKSESPVLELQNKTRSPLIYKAL